MTSIAGPDLPALSRRRPTPSDARLGARRPMVVDTERSVKITIMGRALVPDISTTLDDACLSTNPRPASSSDVETLFRAAP